MNFVVPDFYPAAAEIFVAGMSLLVLMATVFAGQSARSLAYLLTQLTLIGAAFITIGTMDGQVVATLGNMYIDDLMGDFLKLVIYFAVAVALLYSRNYLADRSMDKPEFYVLVIYMTLGMMVMVSANHFVSLYIGLELMSLSLYALVAADRDSARSKSGGAPPGAGPAGRGRRGGRHAATAARRLRPGRSGRARVQGIRSAREGLAGSGRGSIREPLRGPPCAAAGTAGRTRRRERDPDQALAARPAG
jgi:hypothetical protein